MTKVKLRTLQMSNKALIKSAEDFLAYNNVKESFVCPKCDFEVGYICEYCYALDIIRKLTKGLKEI